MKKVTYLLVLISILILGNEVKAQKGYSIDITLDVLPSSLPICSVWLFEDHATSPNSKVLGVAVFADLLIWIFYY